MGVRSASVGALEKRVLERRCPDSGRLQTCRALLETSEHSNAASLPRVGKMSENLSAWPPRSHTHPKESGTVREGRGSYLAPLVLSLLVVKKPPLCSLFSSRELLVHVDFPSGA